MQLTVVEPEPAPEPNRSIEAIVVRMADEGVPVRAIARSTTLSSAIIYNILRDAIEYGSIVELPKDDWPSGSARATRTICLPRLLDSEDALRFACARVFRATKLEAAILGVLIKRTEVTKEQLHQVIENNRANQENREPTDPKMVDVLICHLRKKLKVHGVGITTVWGTGYLIEPEIREIVVAMLLQCNFAGRPVQQLLLEAA